MPAKIALGLGDNIDYEIVWDSQVIEGLVAQYAIQPEELLHPQPIGCERDLILSILQFLQSGKGGERFVDSSPLIGRRWPEHALAQVSRGIEVDLVAARAE